MKRWVENGCVVSAIIDVKWQKSVDSVICADFTPIWHGCMIHIVIPISIKFYMKNETNDNIALIKEHNGTMF
ncbi:hypothetical protein B2I21_32630 [Chryseobacterium mucoviscidosis]|nr:hypothetical protein P364_0106195 [Paenibacillus sp. MAEPY2]KGP88849.1 hypothetical protein P363_0103860 [Paenibacillus sp. MAEPY1]OPG94026.1 hypothetical protein B2I21_32630 [Chryseobacterium mucoviscidosis]OZQ64641.1 hypothetical protein CA599_21780 [Paenibacillus taichungensis]HBU80176.1 hypothetical protein [Paenibacillus sp.]